MIRVVIAILLFVATRTSAQQIMSPLAIQRIEAHLPRLELGIVHDVLEDPTGIWYDRETMGVAYQIGGGESFDREFSSTGRLGVANAMLNVSSTPPESQKPPRFGGNLNTLDFSSFPWNPVPGGTHRSPNVDAVKRFRLPRKANGQPWPVVVFEAELEGFLTPLPTVTGHDWTFPIGTVFLEPILVNDIVAKQHYVCLIRARIRERDQWSVEIMAPFRTALEMQAYLEAVYPNWLGNPQLVALVLHLSSDNTIPGRLHDMTAGNPRFGTRRGDAFNVTARVDRLPSLDRLMVAELLDTVPFKPAAGYQWKPGCTSPTTDSDFHIVPKNYDGAFVGNDSKGCANCHSGAQISARRHEAGNGKYGWGRGNKEGILSWHPFEPSTLTRLPNPTIKLRQLWVDTGLIAYFDPTKHPSSVYHRLVSPVLENAK